MSITSFLGNLNKKSIIEVKHDRKNDALVDEF